MLPELAAAGSPFDDPHFWSTLVRQIEAGQVVPIVGKDLLALDAERFADAPRAPAAAAGAGAADAPQAPPMLYPFLAERLASDLQVEVDRDVIVERDFNAVVAAYRNAPAQYAEVHAALYSVVKAIDQVDVPPAIDKLARMPFPLYITTTFDGLLARAIEEHRGRRPAVESHSTSRGGDLSTPMSPPTVFHLFGELVADADYAMIDEDILEYVASLQSDTNRPSNLFDSLRRKQLLLLGNDFPDWLARFVLRLSRQGPLVKAEGGAVFPDHEPDSRLVYFLQNFGGQTLVFEGVGAREFIDELHARWEQRPQGDAPEAEGGEVPAGVIFLSYASQDVDAASRIRSKLENAGLPVWFDKKRLAVGHDFDDRIHQAISRSALFIPVISRNTLVRESRYFRREWVQALKVASGMAADVRFICPVVVDDTSPDHKALPPGIRKFHAIPAPGGNADDAFAEEIRQAYQEFETPRDPR